MDASPKLVALAAGPGGTGKTTALYEMFISRCPRRVSFDFQGEMRAVFNPAAIDVFSFGEFLAALRRVAALPAWHIALIYDPDAQPDLAAQVVAVLNPARSSSAHTSFALAVGGIAVDCTEADFLWPTGRTLPALRGLVQRGRHNRLCIFAATQAPALVDNRLRDGADYLLAFRTQEDVVWKFWQRVTSARVADMIASLPRFHCGYIVKAAQVVYLLGADRRPYRVVDYTGAASAPPLEVSI